jgi:hypothetical protein
MNEDTRIVDCRSLVTNLKHRRELDQVDNATDLDALVHLRKLKTYQACTWVRAGEEAQGHVQ